MHETLKKNTVMVYTYIYTLTSNFIKYACSTTRWHKHLISQSHGNN